MSARTLRPNTRGRRSIRLSAVLYGVIGICASFAAPSTSWALEESELFIRSPLTYLKTKDSLDRLRQAYESLQSEPSVRSWLKDGTRILSLTRRTAGHGVETTKFQSYYKGLEVVGGMALHHSGTQGAQISNFLSKFDLDAKARLTAEQAVQIAQNLAPGLTLQGSPTLKVLPNEDGASAQLIYWVDLKSDRLDLTGMDILVNAHDGSVVAAMPKHITIAPIQVRQADDTCQELDEDGYPIAIDVKNCKQTVTKGVAKKTASSAARNAMNNTKKVLTYYSNTHGRNSFDSQGSEVVSVVHVGHKFNNAFWSPDLKIMGYGDGDGTEFADFTKAVDVAGHEMTHGVAGNEVQFLHYGQHGALNEAYADFFGKMIANDGDWVMGKKLFLKQTEDTGLRSLSDPHAFTAKDESGVKRPYPSHMSERFQAKQMCHPALNDMCWVHVNATIPGHASYLVAKAIGKDKAEKLYYLTLTQYLTSTSTFATAKKATVKACAQLYDAATCQAVNQAFASVGL